MDRALDLLVRDLLDLFPRDPKLLQILEQDVLRVAPALVARLHVRVGHGPGHGEFVFRTGRGGMEGLLCLVVKQHAEVVFAGASGEGCAFFRDVSAHV